MSRGLKVTKFTDNENNDNNNCFTAITQINLHEPASKLKKWRILLEQSFTVYMSLLAAATSCQLELERTHWSGVIHSLCTVYSLTAYFTKPK